MKDVDDDELFAVKGEVERGASQPRTDPRLASPLLAIPPEGGSRALYRDVGDSPTRARPGLKDLKVVTRGWRRDDKKP